MEVELKASIMPVWFFGERDFMKSFSYKIETNVQQVEHSKFSSEYL